MEKNLHDYETLLQTSHGAIICGDCLDVLSQRESDTVDLIMTSPPFGLVRQKDYGNVAAEDYLDWFRAFGAAFHRVLKDSGSLVIDIGGAWSKGQPTRSLYHFKLLIMLCEELDFHLAQDFYWWNPSRLPTPAEWVTVRRVRVKDAINTVWWLSKTPWPKASNKRVLQPYSPAMKILLKNGYRAKKRPSGHDISEKFGTDNGAAIPQLSALRVLTSLSRKWEAKRSSLAGGTKQGCLWDLTTPGTAALWARRPLCRLTKKRYEPHMSVASPLTPKGMER